MQESDFSLRFSATLKKNSVHALSDVMVTITLEASDSKFCGDKVINTINFNALKFQDTNSINKGAAVLIKNNFEFDKNDYPSRFSYCTSVTGGKIAGI